ncbi:MAG: phosphoadenylyl-sulfate reductase, partial [Bacteroidota bacterium]
ADQIFRYQLPIRIFTIDTGRLFHETQELHQRVLTKYRQKIETFTPHQASIEELITAKGPLSFYESLDNRLECCKIRKVSPLSRALQAAELWITGLRKGQSTYRKQFDLVEWNERHQVIKVNPLIGWNPQAVEAYLARHKVPVNSLHQKGYASVGCAPCTRAIQPGEDERAGRWWWENSHKECGLHI